MYVGAAVIFETEFSYLYLTDPEIWFSVNKGHDSYLEERGYAG